MSTNDSKSSDMSKLSPSLKALINAPFARPGPTAAPAKIRDIYASIARDAAAKKLGLRPWLTITAATTFTLNSPDSLPILHGVASQSTDGVHAAEFIREVGLKCIAFNGIPRTINNLNAFHAALPESVSSSLSTTPSRARTAKNLGPSIERGRGLWDSVYRPFENKLYNKLALAHPDLPVHILNSEYAGLLSDPPTSERGSLANLGRIMTSIIAISCLRAQTGVGPQVLSHVFGLRKGMEDGTYKADNMTAEEEAAARWLASDEGSEWILKTVDEIAEALGGSNFAPAKAKL
ncbi:hypothetical protein Golomagni_05276 [Golovinomyces magnicellulatus]|nr:hypothetical protein Golomagni_05276 [Golovinomyces magnicellulatus]